MSEPNDKQKEEAREMIAPWRLRLDNADSRLPGILTDVIAERLSSRDREIREVLEGLRRAQTMTGNPCWCVDLTTVAHEPACLAARALWEKVQPAKEGKQPNTLKRSGPLK